MATKKPSSKKKTIAINFEGVETGGLPDEGTHPIEILEVDVRDGDEFDYLNLKCKVTDGPSEGKVFYHICSLKPAALFNLKSVLLSLGVDVPDSEYDLDPDDMVGQTAYVQIAHEDYEGKTRARATNWSSEEPTSVAETKSEKASSKTTKKPAAKEEAAAKPTTKSKKKVAEPEPEEEEFTVGMKVTFKDDDGDEQTGKITKIDDESYFVKVGKEEWELEVTDLEAA